MNDARVLELDPRNDSITHCNIYSRGKTRLGRIATNLSDHPVNHPTWGRFRTAEGLWYYLRTGMIHEDLRSMDGFTAKMTGSKLPIVWHKTFEADFKLGLISKIELNPELRDLLVAEPTLPFEHYYVYASKKPLTEVERETLSGASLVKRLFKVVEPKEVKWLTDFWTDQRNILLGK